MSEGWPEGLKRLTVRQLLRLGAASDVEPRRDVLEELGYRARKGSKLSFRYLIAALEDRDPRIRLSACFGLGVANDPAAIPALERLVDDPSEVAPRGTYVGRWARSAIAEITAPPIDDALWSADPWDAAQRQRCVSLLGHPNAEVRGFAANMLGRFGDASVRESLLALTSDDEPYGFYRSVSETAYAALWRLDRRLARRNRDATG